MPSHHRLTRRSTMLGAVAAASIGATRRSGFVAAQEATPGQPRAPVAELSRVPLWLPAAENGIVYGTSLATWQLDDTYPALVDHEAAILFTEDDLLWYKLRPTPDAELDFQFGDQFIALAEEQRQLVFGAHLVWDEGFGEGWTDDDLWGMDEATARALLFGTVESVVDRYRGRVAGWVVVNEVIDAHETDGVRRDYPWYETIGPAFIAESFRLAHAAAPDALLVLNEFGFETDDEFDAAADKREKALIVLDDLLDQGVPVDAFGVQAHLEADDFVAKFDADAYRQFLSDLADRGVTILVTELDVLDDGLPADIAMRDRAVADAYRRFLEVALDEPAVVSVMTFGLTDRYTWLQEDYPREDGEPCRPLPFDEDLQPKPAYVELYAALDAAPSRPAVWQTPRASWAKEAPTINHGVVGRSGFDYGNWLRHHHVDFHGVRRAPVNGIADHDNSDYRR